MIWNNTIGISPNISRLFKIFGKLSYRQVNTLSSTDINQVVLFGRVSSLHFGESKNGKNVYVSIGLVTKNSLKTTNGYLSTVAFHTNAVFALSILTFTSEPYLPCSPIMLTRSGRRSPCYI
ncbi:unnamed protein product [Schistosoma rodhaini]|nr:unnamed protein product [Schistosoma rodhaini]